MSKLANKINDQEPKTEKPKIASGTLRSAINPKAIRFNNVDINRLEDFKKRICDIDGSPSCPDSRAMRALLAISTRLTDEQLEEMIL